MLTFVLILLIFALMLPLGVGSFFRGADHSQYDRPFPKPAKFQFEESAAHKHLSALILEERANSPKLGYQLTATSYRHARSDAFSLWADYTAEMAA